MPELTTTTNNESLYNMVFYENFHRKYKKCLNMTILKKNYYQFLLTVVANFMIIFLCLNFYITAYAESFKVEKATRKTVIRGYTRSIKKAVISSEVSGKIINLNYEVGDIISEKPYAQIDDTFINFDIQNTRMNILKLETGIKQASSKFAYLKKEFNRKETLYKKGHTTEVIRDAASQELNQAILEKNILFQEKKLLKISLNRMYEKKARHIVKGFQNWTVTQINVEIGEVIQVGQPLAIIQDFRHLVVPLAVSSEELNAIRNLAKKSAQFSKNNYTKLPENNNTGLSENKHTGLPENNYTGLSENNHAGLSNTTKYKIKTDNNTDFYKNIKNSLFNAKLEEKDIIVSIYYINPEFDEKSRKNRIKLFIHNYNEEHRGGLSFMLPLKVHSRGLKIPVNAVLNRYENPKVFIKDTTKPVAITILDRLKNYFIIANDKYLSPGTILIKPE